MMLQHFKHFHFQGRPPVSAFVDCHMIVYFAKAEELGEAASSFWIVPGTYNDGEGNVDQIPYHASHQ